MQIQIIIGGEGVKIPYIEIGMSVIVFKIYTYDDNEVLGYTGASNEATLGSFAIDTGWVNVPISSETKSKNWKYLHGKIIYLTMKPSVFASDGGIVEFKLTQKINVEGELIDDSISFVADNCSGWSLVSGDVSFKAEAFTLVNED